MEQWMPFFSALLGAVIGGLISLLATYYTQKIRHTHELNILKKEHDNQRGMLLFEKTKIEKIEGYKFLLSSLHKMRWQIVRTREILKSLTKLQNAIKENRKPSDEELIEILEPLPSDIKMVQYTDFKPILFDDLFKIIKSTYERERIIVEKLHKDSLVNTSLFSLFVDKNILDIAGKIENKIFKMKPLIMTDKEFNEWEKDIQDLFDKLKKEMRKKIQEKKANH